MSQNTSPAAPEPPPESTAEYHHPALPGNAIGAREGCNCIGCQVMRDMEKPAVPENEANAGFVDADRDEQHVRTGDKNLRPEQAELAEALREMDSFDPSNTPVPAPAYRLLETGEIIQEGDEFLDAGAWYRSGAAGARVSGEPNTYRRPITGGAGLHEAATCDQSAPASPKLSVLLAAAEGNPLCFHVINCEGPTFCCAEQCVHDTAAVPHPFVSLSTLLSTVAALASEPLMKELEMERHGTRAKRLQDELDKKARQFEALEGQWQTLIAAVLEYDPISACKRSEDRLEPPAEVVRRIKRERDSLEEDVLSLRGGLNDSRRRLAESNQQRDSHLAVCQSIAEKIEAVFSGDPSLTLEKRVAWVCERAGEKPGAQSINPAVAPLHGLTNEEARYFEAGFRLCPDGCDLVLPGATILAGDVDSAGKPVPEGWVGYAVRAANQVVFRPGPHHPTAANLPLETSEAMAATFSDAPTPQQVRDDAAGNPVHTARMDALKSGVMARVEAFEEAGLLLSELPPAEARVVIAALATVFSV